MTILKGTNLVDGHPTEHCPVFLLVFLIYHLVLSQEHKTQGHMAFTYSSVKGTMEGGAIANLGLWVQVIYKLKIC